MILVTNLFSAQGGIQAYNRDFVKTCGALLPESNFFVLALTDTGAPSGFFGKNVRYFGCGSSGRILGRMKLFLTLLRIMVKENPAFIICGHVNFSPLILFLSYVIGKRHAMLVYGKEATTGLTWMQSLALKKARLIISVSRFTLAAVNPVIAANGKSAVLLPARIDPEQFYIKKPSESLRKDLGIRDEQVLLTVARLSKEEREKGYDTVLRSLRILKQKKYRLKYVVAGEGDDAPRIEKLASSLGVRDSLVLAGFIPPNELPDFYALCDLFVMPSKQEGLGIVYLEALACGKPVIAGNQDGARDALLGGKLGLLVDPDDPEALAAAILRVLKREVSGELLDPDHLREEVLNAFGPVRYEERMLELFKQIEKEAGGC